MEVIHSSNYSRSSTQGSSGTLLAKFQHQVGEEAVTETLMKCQILDHVVTNESSSQGEAQLYIFEDSEAVIKMIIKG